MFSGGKMGLPVLVLLLLLPISEAELVKGNSTVRLAGLGNTCVAMSYQSGSLIGNPAAAVSGNNLSFQLGLAGIDYQSMIPQNGFQAQNQLGLDVLPGFYYARPIGPYDLHVGFMGQLKNQTQIGMEHTRSEYIINEQRFVAKTNLVSTYNLLWQYGWRLGISRKISNGRLGFRIKSLTQRAKAGQILSSLHLDAQHNSDININDPRALIPAIIDSLDFANPSQYLERVDEPNTDHTVAKFDLDFGYQSYFSLQKANDLCIGVMTKNVLQRKLVELLFAEFGIGASYQPNNWMLIGADVFRCNRRFNPNFGLEIGTSWQRGFDGGLAFRVGIQRKETTTLSLGVQLSLGGSTWNYAWQHKTSPTNQHFFGSAIRF